MNLFNYILSFSLISGALYAYYFIFLRKENKLAFNRIYLLAILPISAILPQLELPVFSPAKVSPFISTSLETITITSEAVSLWAYDYNEILSALYMIICLLSMGILILRMSKLIYKIKYSEEKEYIKGATLIYSEGKISPASFGPYIFWDKGSKMSEEEKLQIIQHELCHVEKRHSLDILFMEIWKVLAWFNPMLYLIQSELRMVHEYQADRAASQQGEQHSYIKLILSQTLGQPLQLTHSFFHMHTKNRVMMLMRKPDPRKSRIKYAMLLPFAFALVIACTSEIEEAQVISAENAEKKYLAILDSVPASENGPVMIEMTTVDQQPKPLNINEIKKTIGYPKIARDAGIEGKVLVKVEVNKFGEYVAHEIIESDHDILSRAVEEHLSKLTFETPAKDGKAVTVKVTVPFNFVLID
ncbi:MAG: M56 family metallopeptidase [Bacteroidia bacterium]|nr:M56 family metallopeptidase [Bacteroidia bacterium]